MQILIFRTNIKSKRKIAQVKPELNRHPKVMKWCVDLQDCDNVLRVEAKEGLHHAHIIKMVENKGFFCEDLPG